MSRRRLTDSVSVDELLKMRESDLKGVYGKYKIDSDGISVTMNLPEADECIYLPVDKLPDFINELTAIMRHIPELSKGNEMW